MRPRMILTTLFLLALATACGGAPEPLDKDGIKRNADDAQRDLSRQTK